MRAVRGFEGDPTTRTGLLLAAYTFLRSGEIRSAEWGDVCWKTARLTIPVERMKMKRPHVVPLSRQAVEILKEIQPITGSEKLILPSLRAKGRPVSENTFNAALRRLLGFKAFHSASATLEGIEVAHMIRKGQIGSKGQSVFQAFANLAV